MIKLKINFEISDAGHTFEVDFDDDVLVIMKHQEEIFRGTLEGFYDILYGKVEHSKAMDYVIIKNEIYRILYHLKDKIGKQWI